MGSIESFSTSSSLDGFGRIDDGLHVSLTPLALVVSLRALWTWSLFPALSNKSGFPVWGVRVAYTCSTDGRSSFSDETYAL